MEKKLKYKKKYKRSYKKKKQSCGVKALKSISKLRRDLRPETKFHDLQFVDIPLNTGIISVLNLIPQGVGFSQRVGSAVNLKTLELRANWIPGLTASTFRVIVFIDKDNTLALVTDYLAGAGVLSPKNWNTRFKSNLIMDKVYNINYGAAALGNAGSFVKFLDVKRFKTTYIGATTNIADVALKMITISSSPLVANAPTISFETRLTYTDS